jgi:hypothetical protein
MATAAGRGSFVVSSKTTAMEVGEVMSSVSHDEKIAVEAASSLLLSFEE